MPRKLASIVIVLLLPTLALAQQKPARDMVKEQAIWKQVEQRAPNALIMFKAATGALDRGDNEEAARLFRQVLQQLPDFDVAERRLGSALVALQQSDEGLKLLRRAYDRNHSYENTVTYAHHLAFPGADKAASNGDKQFALMLAQQAAPQATDSSALTLQAQLDLELNRQDDFHRVVDRLQASYPNEMQTHYFAGFRAMLDENWPLAEREIQKAQSLGLPAQLADEVLNTRGHTVWRWVWYAVYLVIAWLAGLAALFVLGKLFSKWTLESLETADPNGATAPRELQLRAWYARLINFAGLYYYVSLPVVALLVIALAGAVIYALLMFRYVAIKLVFIVGIAAMVTVWKMVTSLFIKIEREDPGRALREEEAPALFALTREVATAVGTRPLDEIRLTHGCELAVYEKGSFRDKLNDRAQRNLILGVGVLNGMQQSAFRAVLAHEYGHFAHRDTAGGDAALRVQQDMMKFVIAMALAGQAVWWNLAFQFLRVYDFIFRRLSHGATRLQEVLADRVAVRNYGAPAFETGLRHVIRREVEFHRAATREIDDASAKRRDLANLYQLPAAQDSTEERMIQDEINDIVTRATSEDDTHPSPIDRFRLAQRINNTPPAEHDAPVWDLFANPTALTEEMSGQINQRVQEAIQENIKEVNAPKFTVLED